MARLIAIFMAAALALLPLCARAEVTATFYSHDSDDYFPHAFVVVKGTVDGTGEAVDTNYGFTAKHLTPALLWGSVEGMIETKDAQYVEKSQPRFTLRLDDASYAKLMDLVGKWRDQPQKSYNLGKRNCVHFVMDAAELFGLKVNHESKNFKKPKSFLLEVMALNPELKL